MDIKVGDTVRITDRYASVGGKHLVGTEFEVTRVNRRECWRNMEGEAFTTCVTGDPMGWGVWVNFLEVVQSAEPQGEPSDDGHLITDCEHGVNSLYDRCVPCEVAEQDEPSDAHVRAVWDALGSSVTVHLDYEDLRAALRAAWGTR